MESGRSARHFYQTCIIFFLLLLLNKKVAVHWLSCTFQWGQNLSPYIPHRLAYMSWVIWQRESDTFVLFLLLFSQPEPIWCCTLNFSKYKTVLSREIGAFIIKKERDKEKNNCLFNLIASLRMRYFISTYTIMKLFQSVLLILKQ